MRNNILVKLLCSIPVILILLYFVPFLGICLIIFRYIVCDSRSNRKIPYYLIFSGLIILIPKLLNYLFNILKYKCNIEYFNIIIDSNLYNNEFIKYSKLLIITGIVFLIISYIVNLLFIKAKGYVQSHIEEKNERDYEISKKNDLIMKEKREKAKNTNVVICPYCGADNMLSTKTGICKFCRRKIENKK